MEKQGLGVRDQGLEIVNWQVWRAACWPCPPKNSGGRRQICRTFDRFTGHANDFYPDFDVVVVRHRDRRLGRKLLYVRETGVMIGYVAVTTTLLDRMETISRLDAAARKERES